MAPRANWKGSLVVGEVICPVALYTAASTAERISFHTINRATGHRVRRQFIDSETQQVVAPEDQVKGYEVSDGGYVVLTSDEISAVVPASDKRLTVQAFLHDDDVDEVYFDRPYYLAPADRSNQEAFAIIRDGMREKKVTALAEAILFRRVRTLLIRPHAAGLSAVTLKFNYEVRSADEAFADVPEIKIAGEMLDLAKHIIAKKQQSFDAVQFDDRYERQLQELIRAKQEGRAIVVPAVERPQNVINLMDALRESAGLGGKPAAEGKPRKRAAAADAAKAKAGSSRRKAS